MGMRPSGNLPICSHKSTGPTSGGPASTWIYSYASIWPSSSVFLPNQARFYIVPCELALVLTASLFSSVWVFVKNSGFIDQNSR